MIITDYVRQVRRLKFLKKPWLNIAQDQVSLTKRRLNKTLSNSSQRMGEKCD